MKNLLIALLGVLAVSAGSAQADWIKHDNHGAKGQGANVAKVYFNQVKHGDLDGFVTACKTKCDDNSDTCGGFTLNYATSDKSKPAHCTFKKGGATLVERPTKDFYQVVAHDEVLARLNDLLPNIETKEDAEWLTEVLEAGGFYFCLETAEPAGVRCEGKLRPKLWPTDATGTTVCSYPPADDRCPAGHTHSFSDSGGNSECANLILSGTRLKVDESGAFEATDVSFAGDCRYPDTSISAGHTHSFSDSGGNSECANLILSGTRLKVDESGAFEATDVSFAGDCRYPDTSGPKY